MPECHKCPVSDRIANDEFIHYEFEDTPCFSCSLPTMLSAHGRPHTEFKDAIMAPHANDGDTFQDPRFMKLQEALRALCNLDRMSRDIVMSRIANPKKPLRIIATELGITTQAVHHRLKKACDGSHHLASMIPMKTWKWKGSKTK